MDNQTLINHLVSLGTLKSEDIKSALKDIDRINFVGEINKEYAYYDEALSIGHSQTISQPFTVVFMLELLEIKKGNIILDVGYGSAWQSCLLAHIVGETGFIHAMEIIPEICKMGKDNSSIYPEIKKRVKFYCKNAEDGVPEIMRSNGGFDRIICAAEIREVPQSWMDQLKVGGIMIYPKNKGLYRDTKIDNEKFRSEFYGGFSFVPFTEN